MRASRATSVGAAFLWVACNPEPSPAPVPRDTKPAADVGGETSPAPVAGDRPVQIEAGPSHFCVRLHGGRVACWGDNQGGQLGDGTVLPTDTPVLVRGVADADRLFAGASCAHTAGAGTLCWAGVDACPDCDGVPGSRLRRVPDVVAGSPAIGVPSTPCFVTSAGALRCPGAEQAPPAGLPPLRAVHQGHDFVCGEDREDRLQCYWRADGARFDPGLPASDEVTAGAFHLCVIDDERRVHCWGEPVRSGHAAPRPGRPGHEYGPVAGLDGLRARSVVAGNGHTCAITVQDEVVCWGRPSYRAPGADVPGRWTIDLQGATALAVGYDTACGLVEAGRVYCWGLVDEATDPRRPRPIAGLPVPEGAGLPPPRDTSPLLRAALIWADGPRRLAEIAALDRGLVLGAVREGRWQRGRIACFAEHLQDIDLGRQLEGQWSCDAALSRCVAQREGDATVFLFTDDDRGGRALQAVIDHEGTAPASEPAAVQAELTGDPRGCGLWRALWQRDEALVDDAVVVLHHPDNELGEARSARIRRLCGEEARRAALASMTVDPLAEDWRCDGSECSYSMGQWARGIFVVRRDTSGQPRLWIVGDDFEGDESSVPPLPLATLEGKRHTCPQRQEGARPSMTPGATAPGSGAAPSAAAPRPGALALLYACDEKYASDRCAPGSSDYARWLPAAAVTPTTERILSIEGGGPLGAEWNPSNDVVLLVPAGDGPSRVRVGGATITPGEVTRPGWAAFRVPLSTWRRAERLPRAGDGLATGATGASIRVVEVEIALDGGERRSVIWSTAYGE